jgi:hypothetical protein
LLLPFYYLKVEWNFPPQKIVWFPMYINTLHRKGTEIFLNIDDRSNILQDFNDSTHFDNTPQTQI